MSAHDRDWDVESWPASWGKRGDRGRCVHEWRPDRTEPNKQRCARCGALIVRDRDGQVESYSAGVGEKFK